MPTEKQCVVCTRPLLIGKRADRRYCGSSCRVRAFRVREKRQIQKPGVSQYPRAERTGRLLTSLPGRLLDTTRSQLDLYRELRQARRRIAELTAQATQAQKSWERQRHEQEQARRAFDESVQAERAQLESKLAEAAAQREQDVGTLEDHAAKLRRANERVSELTDELSSGQRTLAQLHAVAAESSRQFSAAETARDAAQEQAQTYKEAAAKAEEERETLRKWALEQMVGLWGSRNSEREEHAQKMTQMEHQLGTAQEQAAALKVRLEQAEGTVREQRDQLDDTALALSEARAAAEPAANAVKLAQAQATAAEAQKELAAQSRKLQTTRQECAATTKSLSEAQEKTRTLEAEIAKLEDAAVEANREHLRALLSMSETNDQLRKANDKLRAQRRFF